MPVEIEAKMAVPALDRVRSRLQEAGAAFAGDFLELNTFFDTEDRTLLAADEGLRLRVNRKAEDAGAQQNILTYKGPRQHGPLKSREELEVEVTSAPDAAALLERLGFLKMLSFEKRRQSWTLGECKIELDELPYLGSYVEIEGPSHDVVMKTRQLLNLEDRPIVKASYIALLLGYLQERGQSPRTVTFANAKT